MRVFTCTNFEGHYPVGVSAVIVANGENHARDLLLAELKAEGLGLDNPLALSLEEVDLTNPGAKILQNGNY